jgi:hypothetical protein
MIIRLVIDFWELVKVALKRGEAGKEVKRWVDELRGMGLLCFVTLVCVWVYFCCYSGGCCVRDCRGLELCTLNTVGYLAGGEYIGGRGSMVTCWGRIRGRSEDRGKSA